MEEFGGGGGLVDGRVLVVKKGFKCNTLQDVP